MFKFAFCLFLSGHINTNISAMSQYWQLLYQLGFTCHTSHCKQPVYAVLCAVQMKHGFSVKAATYSSHRQSRPSTENKIEQRQNTLPANEAQRCNSLSFASKSSIKLQFYSDLNCCVDKQL